MEHNTLEHLHQLHHDKHDMMHQQQMDQIMLPTASGQFSSQTPPMISYDQPAPMHHHQQQQQHDLTGHMSMMKMYFHFGLGDMVLFPSLVMDSRTKLWLTCLVLFLAAILLEMIDYSRGYLSCRCQSSQASRRANSSTSSETDLVDTTGGELQDAAPGAHGRRGRRWNCCAGTARNSPAETHSEQGQDQGYGTWHKGQEEYFEPRFFPVYSPEPQLYRLLQASLQFLRTGLSLCLMLVAMTYNVCLIFAILLGSAVGYYIFYRPALDSKSVVCH